MKVSDAGLNEFKRICHDDLAAELTDEEALEAAQRLLLVGEIIMKSEKANRAAKKARNVRRRADNNTADDELEFFLTCLECGQSFDTRDDEQVKQHGKSGHRPQPRS